jgi:UDP-N-acetylglucosamine 2-epimerase
MVTTLRIGVSAATQVPYNPFGLHQHFRQHHPSTEGHDRMRIVSVVGARPQFIKAAPVCRALREQHEEILVHSGQHFDYGMSDVFFEQLGIPAPDYNLGVGGGGHGRMTGEMLGLLEELIVELTPDAVLVYGDTNTTLAAGLAAAKLHVPVAHIEAGLRSFNRTMPEEINRLVTDSLADLLLTPSEDANENLRREGVPESKIRLVGNIMIDSLVAHLGKVDQTDTLRRLDLSEQSFFYVTLHRPSNVDARENLGMILNALAGVATCWPVVFAVHPRTRKRMEEFGLPIPDGASFRLIEPVGYVDSLTLTKHARCVITARVSSVTDSDPNHGLTWIFSGQRAEESWTSAS